VGAVCRSLTPGCAAPPRRHGGDVALPQARACPAMMDELGRVLRNVLALLKRGGVICFFPSYAYAQQVWERWQQSGQLRALQALTGVPGAAGGGGGGGGGVPRGGRWALCLLLGRPGW
jgi:hypothetical protein